MQEITDRKADYEAAIDATLQAMADRVETEQDDADTAYTNAMNELQAEFDRLTGEMNEAIFEAVRENNVILETAKAAQEDSISNATL